MSAVSQNPCTADTQCEQHRLCMFGTQDRYQTVFDYMVNITGCTNCANNCDCLCFIPSQPSSIQTEIDNNLWCDLSLLCKGDVAHIIMNYPTDNLECESNFRTMQSKFIELCGSVGNSCCNGQCKSEYDITQPSMPCENSSKEGPHTRWIISAYIVIVTILTQWKITGSTAV